MNKYQVVSETYKTRTAVMYGDPQPPEYGCDVEEIEAESVNEAKKEFVRKLRDKSGGTILDRRPDQNPFALIDEVINIDELEKCKND